MTALPEPVKSTDEPNCNQHYEASINNFDFGHITCNDVTSLIFNGNRYALSSAVNYSANPSIEPGISGILALSNWWKIEYNNIAYFCLNTPLSPSGDGDNVLQHYLVENVFNNGTPALYFYFFNKNIDPISSV